MLAAYLAEQHSNAGQGGPSACSISFAACSHRLGHCNISFAARSHEQGQCNVSCAACSHKQGQCNVSFAACSHRQGQCNVSCAACSHRQGQCDVSCAACSHRQGQCNISCAACNYRKAYCAWQNRCSGTIWSGSMRTVAWLGHYVLRSVLQCVQHVRFDFARRAAAVIWWSRMVCTFTTVSIPW